MSNPYVKPSCRFCNDHGYVFDDYDDKWLCECQVYWRIDMDEWDYEVDQDESEDLLIPIDREDWQLCSLEYHAHVENLTLDDARFDLAGMVKSGQWQIEWINHRLFLMNAVPSELRVTNEDELRAKYEECPLVTTPWSDELCRWCGKPSLDDHGQYARFCSHEHSLAYGRNHKWQQARGAAMRRDGRKCVRCDLPAQSVNHIVPILGKHNTQGCHHHLDNLESVCNEHHRLATNEQRRAGYF